jgi:hypothetical protein
MSNSTEHKIVLEHPFLSQELREAAQAINDFNEKSFNTNDYNKLKNAIKNYLKYFQRLLTHTTNSQLAIISAVYFKHLEDSAIKLLKRIKQLQKPKEEKSPTTEKPSELVSFISCANFILDALASESRKNKDNPGRLPSAESSNSLEFTDLEEREEQKNDKPTEKTLNEKIKDDLNHQCQSVVQDFKSIIEYYEKLLEYLTNTDKPLDIIDTWKLKRIRLQDGHMFSPSVFKKLFPNKNIPNINEKHCLEFSRLSFSFLELSRELKHHESHGFLLFSDIRSKFSATTTQDDLLEIANKFHNYFQSLTKTITADLLQQETNAIKKLHQKYNLTDQNNDFREYCRDIIRYGETKRQLSDFSKTQHLHHELAEIRQRLQSEKKYKDDKIKNIKKQINRLFRDSLRLPIEISNTEKWCYAELTELNSADEIRKKLIELKNELGNKKIYLLNYDKNENSPNWVICYLDQNNEVKKINKEDVTKLPEGTLPNKGYNQLSKRERSLFAIKVQKQLALPKFNWAIRNDNKSSMHNNQATPTEGIESNNDAEFYHSRYLTHQDCSPMVGSKKAKTRAIKKSNERRTKVFTFLTSINEAAAAAFGSLAVLSIVFPPLIPIVVPAIFIGGFICTYFLVKKDLRNDVLDNFLVTEKINGKDVRRVLIKDDNSEATTSGKIAMAIFGSTALGAGLCYAALGLVSMVALGGSIGLAIALFPALATAVGLFAIFFVGISVRAKKVEFSKEFIKQGAKELWKDTKQWFKFFKEKTFTEKCNYVVSKFFGGIGFLLKLSLTALAVLAISGIFKKDISSAIKTHFKDASASTAADIALICCIMNAFPATLFGYDKNKSLFHNLDVVFKSIMPESWHRNKLKYALGATGIIVGTIVVNVAIVAYKLTKFSLRAALTTPTTILLSFAGACEWLIKRPFSKSPNIKCWRGLKKFINFIFRPKKYKNIGGAASGYNENDFADVTENAIQALSNETLDDAKKVVLASATGNGIGQMGIASTSYAPAYLAKVFVRIKSFVSKISKHLGNFFGKFSNKTVATSTAIAAIADNSMPANAIASDAAIKAKRPIETKNMSASKSESDDASHQSKNTSTPASRNCCSFFEFKESSQPNNKPTTTTNTLRGMQLF